LVGLNIGTPGWTAPCERQSPARLYTMIEILSQRLSRQP